MGKHEKDLAWSNLFIPRIKQILGELFISTGSPVQDKSQNTDLICFNLAGKRFACQVRRNEFWRLYPYQITIRAARPFGNKTEFQKILDGWGDYFFYGFACNDNKHFLQWCLGDLAVFRRAHLNMLGMLKFNKDNSSDFLVYHWRDLPAAFFVGFSFADDLTMDLCASCLIPTVIYLDRCHKRICPACLRLYDYTIMIKRYNDEIALIDARKMG